MWQRTSLAHLASKAGSLGLMLLVVCLLAGCQGPHLMPTPNVYVQASSSAFAALAPPLRTSTVDVLYATDRQPQPLDNGSLAYGRSLSLAVGSCVVELGQNIAWDTLLEESQQAKRSQKLPLRIRSYFYHHPAVSVTSSNRVARAVPCVNVGPIFARPPRTIQVFQAHHCSER